MKKYDLIVLGGGSGGVATANRAAINGAKVCLFESNKLGGTCVNVGCVPKKIMWTAANLQSSFSEYVDYGFYRSKNPKLNWGKLIARRDNYITKLNKIYEKNLTNNGVEIINSYAKFYDKNTITSEGKKYIASKIVIAVGGRPIIPEIIGSEFGITSDGFFKLKKMPKTVCIVGSGYIAVEIACLLNSLGSKVSLLIRKRSILNDFDSALGKHLLKHMAENGIDFHFETKVSQIKKSEGKLILYVNKKETIQSECVLWAIGRKPNTDKIDIENAGVKVNSNGSISVTKYQKTNIKNIFAIGDILKKFELTPVAIAAGRRLADRIFGGKNSYLTYKNIPSVIFSHPPIGSIGLSEDNAVIKYGEKKIKVYETEFKAMHYAFSNKYHLSFMKLIVAGKNEKIVGCHLLGHSSDEMLQGFAVAINMGAKKKDFDQTVAIHPTISEELVTLKVSRNSTKLK